MPRKATKEDKPALQFLERPVGGARLQHAPEVRAAVNPKEFFSETRKTANSSDCNSWVNTEFDFSAASAPPKRRGRRKRQTATSLLDRCSHMSRKNSTCKYPSLSFHIGLRDQSLQQPKSTSATKGAVSKVRNQPRESVCRSKMTVSNRAYPDAPNSKLVTNRSRTVQKLSESAASNTRSLDQHAVRSKEVSSRCRIPAEEASTPASSKSVCPPPDVEIPQTMWEEVNCSSSSPRLVLFASPHTPPCSGPPDTLVANTPERDYGVKVTWRRRKGLLKMLKERGHLAESDALIH